MSDDVFEVDLLLEADAESVADCVLDNEPNVSVTDMDSVAVCDGVFGGVKVRLFVVVSDIEWVSV